MSGEKSKIIHEPWDRAKLLGGTALSIACLFAANHVSSGDNNPSKAGVHPVPVESKSSAPTLLWSLRHRATMRRIIRPVMIKNARQIMAAAKNYPELVHKTVGDNVVMLSVGGSSEIRRNDGHTEDDATNLYIMTGRIPGSSALDLQNIESEQVSRSQVVLGEPHKGFRAQGFGLYNLNHGLGPNYVATSAFNPFRLGVGNGWAEADNPLEASNLNSFAARGSDAASVAEKVVRIAPNILDMAEVDLATMSPWQASSR